MAARADVLGVARRRPGARCCLLSAATVAELSFADISEPHIGSGMGMAAVFVNEP